METSTKQGRAVAWTAALLLLVTGLGSTPGVYADGDECRADEKGWERESAKCGFSCDSGRTLFVDGGVNDDGYIEVRAECSDQTLECTDDDGGCYKRGEKRTSSSATDGECKGAFNGGGYTKGYIRCGSGDGNSESEGDGTGFPIPIPDDFKLSDCDVVRALMTTMPATTGNFQIVSMTAESGKYTGLVFTADTCHTFSPSVQTSEDGTVLSFA